jgi:hypothetical protein
MSYTTIARRQQVERSIVRATIKAAIAKGFELVAVSNGEDFVETTSVRRAMVVAFECDEAHVYFRKPGSEYSHWSSWFFVVLGNEGWTVISDYTVDLEVAVRDTEPLVEKYEAEYYR